MVINKKIHFEISERKILLRIFDVLSVMLALYLVSIAFNFKYFSISTNNYYWTIVLGLYINMFGTVFEMYNLQVASNQFQVIKSIILTASTTVLVYLLTPIYTPVLPNNRLQILIFYVAILLALFIWRIFYLKFLASSRFEKKVILICDKDQAKELILGLETVDPHYKVMGFVNSDSNQSGSVKVNGENIKNINILDVCSKNRQLKSSDCL